MTGSSSKLLQIEGTWHQEKNLKENPKPYQTNPKTILHQYLKNTLKYHIIPSYSIPDSLSTFRALRWHGQAADIEDDGSYQGPGSKKLVT
jgi:hypothetical protein